MRIVHVIDTLNPRAGGPPAVAVQLSGAQSLAGHEVSIVSREGKLPDAFNWVPGVNKVRMVAVPPERWGNYLTMPEGAKVVGNLLVGADAVHMHGVWEPLLWMTGRAAREAGVPYVVRPAGMLDPWSLSQKWVKKRIALRLGLRPMLERAAFVHALNRDERDLVGLLGLGCPTEVVPNGVFLESLSGAPPAGAFRAKHPALGQDPFVLFMARLHYKKGLDHLADAFQAIAARAPTLKLVVAGHDMGARAPFLSRIERFGLTSRVLMVGELYGSEKLGALRDATVFCLPSRQEGFSVAVIEALAMGLPSVVSSACHFPEVATANCGRVVELKPRAIGEALLQVVQEPALRAQMSENASRFVRSGYTWPIIAQRCVDLYGKYRPGAARRADKLRIMHVVDTLDPAAGGPPVVAVKLATSQAALGHEVRMLSYSSPSPTAENDVRAMIRQVPDADLVEQHRLLPRTRVESLTGRSAGLAVRAMLGQLDVVHLHGVWEPMLKTVAAACERAGVPYVVMPHGMLDPWSLGQKRLKKRLGMFLGVRRMLDRAAFVHAMNRDERDLMRPLGLASEFEQVANGIFPSEVTDLPAKGTFRAAYPQVGDKPYVLFLSRLHFKKGLDYLADAFAILAPVHPDVNLVVAGPDGGARRDFERRVAAADLTPRVHLVGPVYNELKTGAIVDAAAFCLPSRQEGFSIAIIEALGAGCPCVVSDACHFPEVQEQGAGYVVPLDPKRIAEALSKILSDPAAAATMGEAGRRYVIENLTWPVIARQLVAAYERHGAKPRGT